MIKQDYTHSNLLGEIHSIAARCFIWFFKLCGWPLTSPMFLENEIESSYHLSIPLNCPGSVSAWKKQLWMWQIMTTGLSSLLTSVGNPQKDSKLYVSCKSKGSSVQSSFLLWCEYQNSLFGFEKRSVYWTLLIFRIALSVDGKEYDSRRGMRGWQDNTNE